MILKYLFFFTVGVLTSAAVDILMRSKSSKRSPKKFSLSFFWKDNKEKFLISHGIGLLFAIANYITTPSFHWFIEHLWDAFGLNPEYFSKFERHGSLDLVIAFVCGFVPDTILSYIARKKKILKPDRIVEKGENYVRK